MASPLLVVCLLLLLPAIDTIFHGRRSRPSVQLPNMGAMKGTKMVTKGGKTVYVFKGIPYAEPPVGELRFQPTVRKRPWSSKKTLDVSKDGPSCMQNSGENIDEDCLYLNVYTTQNPSKLSLQRQAVMVYIHDGSFFSRAGSSNQYSPRLLLDYDVLLVTFNYRVGAFGFLSTGDGSLPGNYGLLDQVEALKWVQTHIPFFGGDPTKVTVFGEGLGAASVLYHILSPISSGLFSRAIAMSGSPLCHWALQNDPDYWIEKLALDLHCPLASTQDMIECLRMTPAKDIVKLVSFLPYSWTSFGPVVDEYFIPQHPEVLLRRGYFRKIPLILGITKDEGAYVFAYLKSFFKQKKFSENEIRLFLTDLVDDRPNATKAIEEVMRFYFRGISLDNDYAVQRAFINTYSDGMFRHCIHRTAHETARIQLPTYFYSYDHQANYSASQVFLEPLLGVSHGDDLFTLFEGNDHFDVKKSADDEVVGGYVRTLWTDFAKMGEVHRKPEVPITWLSVKGKDHAILHLLHPLAVKEFVESRNKWFQLWENVGSLN